MVSVREYNDMIIDDEGLYLNDRKRNKYAEQFIYNNKYKIIDGDLYAKVEINDIIDLDGKFVRLCELNNKEEMLEKIRLKIQERFGVDVIYVDHLDKYVYEKSGYLYYSNGGVCCIFEKNDLITVYLAKDNMLNNVFPYNYSNECRYAIYYIKQFCGHKNNEYYEFYLDEPYTTETRDNFDNIRKERLVELKPSLSTKSARKI